MDLLLKLWDQTSPKEILRALLALRPEGGFSFDLEKLSPQEVEDCFTETVRRLGCGTLWVSSLPLPRQEMVDFIPKSALYWHDQSVDWSIDSLRFIERHFSSLVAETSFTILKLMSIGESGRLYLIERSNASLQAEEAILLETNIDNMNPEVYGYLMNLLLEHGARDVFYTPILMKKGRPATKVSVLCAPEKEKRLMADLFAETTTLGIRRQRLWTERLIRRFYSVNTKWGPISIKVGYWQNQIRSAQPEFEDCVKVAKENEVPYQEVQRAALLAWHEKQQREGLF